MSLPSPEQCLSAVRDRDTRFDGVFVYGVLSTGVFCRPSCPAKPARVENLRWFATVDAARAAGFRACKRCKPEQDESEPQRLERLARWLIAHCDEDLGLTDLGRMAGMAPTQFQRKFKAWLGLSPKQLMDAARLQSFKDSLRQGKSITEAIVDAGFGSSSRLYGERLRHLGMTPSAWRKGGAGEQITYACTDTELGALMMAATPKGVCFAEFGVDQSSLLEQLRREFPRAQLAESTAKDSPELHAWLSALRCHLNSDAPRPEVPVDLRGTAFQIKVWRFLLSTATGDVVSYGELAKRIDAPNAHRAVASACARNRIAVLVPCHRVLAGDGGLAGYRWGVARKRALLAHEKASSVALQKA